MPFSPERTQLIKARIKEKLSTRSLDAWQRSFLTNMDQKFTQYGEKTRLSTAQCRKLHEILGIELTDSQSAKQPKPSRVPSKVASKSRSRRSAPVNPLRIINAPRRAIRRVERQLFVPVLIVFGLVTLLSAFFDTEPEYRATGTSIGEAPSVWYVTGTNVNQRSGPGTNHAVMGQLAQGAKVRLLNRQNGWSKISSRLGEGWMSSSYLSQNRTSGATQSTAAPSAYPYFEFQTLRASQVRIIDGDTIAVPGLSADVRLVGFNTPETYRAKCTAEKNLGNRATARLRQLVSTAASIQVRRVACACKPGTEGTKQCNFGRLCGTLLVDGRDVGSILIGERLAVPFRCGKTSCPRKPSKWCQ